MEHTVLRYENLQNSGGEDLIHINYKIFLSLFSQNFDTGRFFVLPFEVKDGTLLEKRQKLL